MYSPWVFRIGRSVTWQDAGGSRTHFRGFANRRPAVRLRHRMSSPGVEPGLRPSQGRVQIPHTPRTIMLSEASPARESNPVSRLRRPPCVRHTRGDGNVKSRCPCQESNLVFDLRRVACRPAHSKGMSRARKAAGTQGFEPCPRVLEARCSPRSTSLDVPPARYAGGSGVGCFSGPHDDISASAGSSSRNFDQLSTRPGCAA